MLVGEDIVRANADFVLEQTGYAIGSVPPMGHDVSPVVLLDQNLTLFEQIWAAAGTPNVVFRLTPEYLQELTGGEYLDISEKECQRSM